MADNTAPLSDEERAELERLRAEKAARDQERADVARRNELEELRREQAEAEADERDAARREAARELMEPDEDLRMPLAQKIVLLLVAFLIAWFAITLVGGGIARP